MRGARKKKEKEMVLWSDLKTARPLLLAQQAGFASSFLNILTNPVQTPARRCHYRQLSVSTLLRSMWRERLPTPASGRVLPFGQISGVMFWPISGRTTTIRPLLLYLLMQTKLYNLIQDTDWCPVRAPRLSEALLLPCSLHVPLTLWPPLERNVLPVRHALTN